MTDHGSQHPNGAPSGKEQEFAIGPLFRDVGGQPDEETVGREAEATPSEEAPEPNAQPSWRGIDGWVAESEWDGVRLSLSMSEADLQAIRERYARKFTGEQREISHAAFAFLIAKQALSKRTTLKGLVSTFGFIVQQLLLRWTGTITGNPRYEPPAWVKHLEAAFTNQILKTLRRADGKAIDRFEGAASRGRREKIAACMDTELARLLKIVDLPQRFGILFPCFPDLATEIGVPRRSWQAIRVECAVTPETGPQAPPRSGQEAKAPSRSAIERRRREAFIRKLADPILVILRGSPGGRLTSSGIMRLLPAGLRMAITEKGGKTAITSAVALLRKEGHPIPWDKYEEV